MCERYILSLDVIARDNARRCDEIIKKFLTPEMEMGWSIKSILLSLRVHCARGTKLETFPRLVTRSRNSRRSRPKESLHLLNPHILTRLSSAPTPLTGTYSICAENVCTFTSRRYVQHTTCLRSTLFLSFVDPRQPERPTPAPRYRA